jgi:hypothetical protein
MMASPFSEWLAEIEGDSVVVRPDDVIAEAQGNLYTFGLTEEQYAARPQSEVETFVREVAESRGRWLAKRGGRMQFYCWHDAQAGQLRMSLVSAASTLPFGCVIDPSAELSVVVDSFLRKDWSDRPALPVWVTTIP